MIFFGRFSQSSVLEYVPEFFDMNSRIDVIVFRVEECFWAVNASKSSPTDLETQTTFLFSICILCMNTQLESKYKLNKTLIFMDILFYFLKLGLSKLIGKQNDKNYICWWDTIIFLFRASVFERKRESFNRHAMKTSPQKN